MKLRKAAAATTILTAALVATLATAAVAAAAPTQARAGTTTENVRPVTASGTLKPGYHVTDTKRHASCIKGGSETIRNADRCFAGNFVVDPCWPGTNGRGRYVADYCLPVPWSHSVLRLKGAKPHVSGHGRGLWALRLRSGARCAFVGGGTSVFHGKRLNFACPHNRWLVGKPNRTQPTWTIMQVTETRNGPRHAHRVAIAHAWFGVVG